VGDENRLDLGGAEPLARHVDRVVAPAPDEPVFVLAGPLVTDLARRTGMAKQAVSRLADRLVILGYCDRQRSQTNRRQVLLRPTQEGVYAHFARVAESVTTGIRKRDYTDAAKLSGASALTIMRVQVLGNVVGPIFVYATSRISVSMILASGLSFLGLGVRPPEPEWGLMLNTLRTAIYNNPWVAALPGAMIFAVSICFNLLSDGMRSAMDIRN